MIFTKDMKNLKIYKRQLFLPTLENSDTPNKKTKSVIFLLTPNRESSLSIMRNPLFINKRRYISYYIERDMTYYINQKKEIVSESTSEYVSNNNGELLKIEGYSQDVDILSKIITTDTIKDILEDLRLTPGITAPIVKLIVGDFPDIDEYFSFFVTDIDDTKLVTIHVPRLGSTGIEEYSKRILNFIYKALFITFHPDQYGTANPSIYADTMTGADTKYAGREFNDFKDEIYEASPISIENLGKKFKYATTSKFKRQFSTKLNTLKRTMNNVTSQFQKQVSAGSISIPNVGSPSVKESYLETLEEGTDYIRLGDNRVVFFDEASYIDTALKKTLYLDRIRTRNQVLELDDQIKVDVPYIKFAYPELNRYGQKNIFADLYYYNQVFFRNNTYKLNRGFDIYFTLLNRLINDKRITSAGYKKKTIIIPIKDWNQNPATKMWIYRQDINPISIIYELMLNRTDQCVKVFGDTDLLFFDSNKYFKINFKEFKDNKAIKEAAMKFRLHIAKILSNSTFDREDVDDSVTTKPDAIRASIYDKIEDAKGVDLTGKEVIKNVNDIEKQIKDEEKDRTQTVNVDKLKTDIDKMQKLATDIDNYAQTSTSTDDALDSMANDIEIKKMISELDGVGNNSVNMDPTRAARMNKLNDDLMNQEVGGKTVKELLEEKPKEEPLKTTAIPIASPFNEWQNLTYTNFDKSYDLNRDIVACIYHFTKGVSYPIGVRKIEAEDTSTSEDRKVTYTIDTEDFRGTRQKIRLDIPIIKDNRFMLRGNFKTIATQFVNMPILKTDLNAAQVITNYQKIFVYLHKNSLGRSNPISSRLIKALQKYKGSNLKIVFGDNSRISNKYQLPIDYIDISRMIDTIEYKSKKIKIYFNQDQMRKEYPEIDDTKGIPYAVMEGKILYYDNMNTFFAQSVLNLLITDKNFAELYDSQRPTTAGTYVRASILNVKIPMILVLGFGFGIDAVLKRANIPFKWQEKLSQEDRLNPTLAYIRFSDGYLVYAISYMSCILLNGLIDCNISAYSMADMNSRSTYSEMLENYGGRFKTDGLANFIDCLLDPITVEILEYYKLPTDFLGVMLYATALMADNKYVKHTDTSSRRIRRAELVAAYTYEALSEAYGTWARQLRAGRSNATLVLKQTAVIDKILQSPITQDDSVNNALGALEETNTIAYKGKSGLNSDRSYSLDKRTYDDSMLNVMGGSTNFSANAGITRQSTINMNIETSRGFVKQINSDTSQMNTVNTLTATEAMIPFEVTNDDNPRVLMSYIQTAKHQVRTKHSDPLLVTSGMDEALPYLTTDIFAVKAEQDGKVIALDTDKIIIQYKDGSKKYINLTKTIQKNSDGGYYVPMQLIASAKLKVGKTFKQGEILAYDPDSFSNSLGEDDNIAYNVGTLAKVAVLNSDECFEDSGICTHKLADKLTTQVIYKFEHVIEKDAIIYQIAKIGQYVNVEDPLLVWQDPYEDDNINNILKLTSDQDTSTLGRQVIQSETTGTVVDIKIYKTCENSDMSDSVRKLVESYERPIKKLKKELDEQGIDTKTLPATYVLPTTGKLKKAEDAIYIEFYVQHDDVPGVGDKITYFAANKATLRNVIPEGFEPYTDFRKDEEISALLSISSINHRMVTSILMNGSLNKLMIELDRSCKDILGIPYDVKNL